MIKIDWSPTTSVLNPGGSRLADLPQTLLHRVSNRDGVLARLFRDDQSHGRLAVQTRFGARLFSSVFRVTDVAEFDCVSAAIRDDEIVELGGLDDAAHRAHRQFARAFVNTSARHFEILRAHCISNLRDSDVERAHLVWVDPDLDLATASADDLNVADAVDRFDLLLDLVVGNVCDFAQRAWR